MPEAIKLALEATIINMIFLGIMAMLINLIKEKDFYKGGGMKRFKPKFYEKIYTLINDEMFIDVESLQSCKKDKLVPKRFYKSLVSSFGKDVFVFDINACEFLKEEK